eukprot:366196-Chlamydomonas_euryale.AAC.5
MAVVASRVPCLSYWQVGRACDDQGASHMSSPSACSTQLAARTLVDWLPSCPPCLADARIHDPPPGTPHHERHVVDATVTQSFDSHPCPTCSHTDGTTWRCRRPCRPCAAVAIADAATAAAAAAGSGRGTRGRSVGGSQPLAARARATAPSTRPKA